MRDSVSIRQKHIPPARLNFKLIMRIGSRREHCLSLLAYDRTSLERSTGNILPANRCPIFKAVRLDQLINGHRPGFPNQTCKFHTLFRVRRVIRVLQKVVQLRSFRNKFGRDYITLLPVFTNLHFLCYSVNSCVERIVHDFPFRPRRTWAIAPFFLFIYSFRYE